MSISRYILLELPYLGAYGTHMFALRVWVGDGTSKTFFSCSITLKMCFDPRTPNLCLDLEYLDGKRVKTLMKHTIRHEMNGWEGGQNLDQTHKQT